MTKVGIIGDGNVGATVALLIVENGYADELVLIDKNREKAVSDAIDFQDAASLLKHHVKVYVGDYPDLKDADIAISTLGHIDLITSASADRFTELRANIPEIAEAAAGINASGFKGILIGTTNPNDVIMDMYHQQLNLPQERILGTGTYLDTARMKHYVGDSIDIDPRSVEGYTLGEHGNSQFVAWSTVRIANRPFSEIAAERNISLDELDEATRQGGFTAFAGKGYTNIAIAEATVGLMKLVLSDAKNLAICSHYDPQFDSYISTPAIIGAGGVEKLIDLELTDEEKAKLQHSADEIQQKIKEFS